ncbi:hypothetical protein CR513_43418, partial [Mucuna pruriens]
MIVKEDEEYVSESSAGEISTFNESESLSDGSHYEGDLLVRIVLKPLSPREVQEDQQKMKIEREVREKPREK